MMASPDTEEEMENDDKGYILVRRVTKILTQVAENLEDHELSKFVTILKRGIDMDPLQQDTELEEMIVSLTDLTMFRRGISVNLIKQAVRCLIELKLDKWLGNEVWQVICSLATRLTFSIEADFGELDPETLRKYHELLKGGTENVRHIRLMVVGMFGVGKTTIIRRLCNEDTGNVRSTVGIDVSVNACEVDDNKEWRVTDLKTKNKKYYKSRISGAYKKSKSLKEEETNIKGGQNIPQKAEVSPVSIVEPDVDETYMQDGSPIDSDRPLPSISAQNENTAPKNIRPAEGYNVLRQRLTERKEPREELFVKDLREAVDDNDTQSGTEKRITTVSIWDFAGQSIYYSTHHFFLSSRAIYLLVLNISKELSEPVGEDNLIKDGCDRATSMPKGFTCLDAFKFWMNSIYTYTSSRKDNSTKYLPKIFLVGTFKDEVAKKKNRCDDDFLENYKENYFNEALQSFIGTEVINLVHKKKYFVSKDDPEKIFTAIKDELYNIAEDQPFWNEIVPLKWIPLERSIEVRKGDPCLENEDANQSKSLMALSELEDIDQNTEMPLADRDQMKLFLTFQHALGNVLFYNTKQLDDNIILDPQWILDVFKLFVTHTREKAPQHLEEWKNYEENAILSLTVIAELVNQSRNETFINFKEKIIQYMEHLDVIAKPVKYQLELCDEESSSEEEDEERIKGRQPWENREEDFYIVPCLLSEKPPKDVHQPKYTQFSASTPVLCMVFRNKFLPAFVCHRLVASCIREWEVPRYDIKRLTLFNGFGKFYLDPTKTLILSLWWKDFIIFLEITQLSTKLKPINRIKCSNARNKIQKMIREIFSIHRNLAGDEAQNQKMFDEFIKCPECKESERSKETFVDTGNEENSSTLLRVDKFYKNDEMACGRGHVLKRDSALSNWYYEKNENLKLEKIMKLRKQVFEWLKENKDDDEINDTHLANLSESIGTEYFALSIVLGVDSHRIGRFEEEVKDVNTRIFKILQYWKSSCTEPKVLHIKNAILKILGIRCTKKGKFKEQPITKKTIVNWFEERCDSGDQPSENDLVDVTHFIGVKYRKVAKRLLKDNHYVIIELIEERYTLDFNRALVVLLRWRQLTDNLTFKCLKECVEKVLRINWNDVRSEIARDKKQLIKDDEFVDSDDSDQNDVVYGKEFSGDEVDTSYAGINENEVTKMSNAGEQSSTREMTDDM